MKRNKGTPPHLAAWFLARMTRAEERESIKSDFAEIYTEIKKETGGSNARRWYRSQVFKSMPMFLRIQISWSFTMIKNYFKMAVRILQRNKIFSSVNIIGLTLGIACCTIILIWIFDELGYDQFHAHKKNIYRVTQQHAFEGHSATTNLPLAEYMKTDFQEVEKFVRFLPTKGLIRLDPQQGYKEDRLFLVDPDIFEVFSFSMIDGDQKSALSGPNSIVLTEKLSQKYFGDENPIGKVLKYNNLEFYGEEEKPLKITGVVKNIPHNSHIQFDALISLPTFNELEGHGQHLWHWPPVYTYILLSDQNSLNKINSQISEFKANHLPKKEAEVRDFHFQPLRNIHLQSHLKYELEANGDLTQVYIFIAIAALIIFIACLNYINLSTACGIKRTQEIGIKKVLGAKPLHLLFQFFGESLMFVLTSYVFALGIVVAAMPFFNQLLNKNMNFFALLERSPLFLLIQVAFLFLITVLAGAYPALFLSRFQPPSALKNKYRISGSSLRKALVIAQFAISVILISAAFIVYQQMTFIQKKNLGFNKENILVVPLQGDKIIDNVDVLKERLLQNTELKNFTTYSNVIGANDRIYAYPIKAEGIPDDRHFEMSILIVDYDFIDTFNLEIVEGRKFLETAMTDREGIIINEAAKDLLRWDHPLGKKLDVKYIQEGNDFSGRIIGVVKDFNLRTLHHKIEPLVMFVSDQNNVDSLLGYISLKINSANIPATLEFLRDRWAEMESGELFEYTFLDERIERQYQVEKKAMQLITYFSCMAILIACFGLYGLSSFMTEAKTKEIGIRRVLGASVSGITVMLSLEFLKWIFLANLIAIPGAYFVGKKWLQNFAFRTDIGIWIFVFSSILALVIALFTVSYQTIKAATANPVDSLRYE